MEAAVVITSKDLLDLPTPLHKRVKYLVYFPTLATSIGKPSALEKVSNGGSIECISFAQLLKRGESAVDMVVYDINTSSITPDTPAVILYTSGSTGKPKGVILTHKNFVSTMKGVYSIIPDNQMAQHEHHVWYGFLPLAHILEFVAENALFCLGFRLGYGSPFTMTDLSTGIIRGQPGDLTLCCKQQKASKGQKQVVIHGLIKV